MNQRFADLGELEEYLLKLNHDPSTYALQNTLSHAPMTDGQMSLIFSRA